MTSSRVLTSNELLRSCAEASQHPQPVIQQAEDLIPACTQPRTSDHGHLVPASRERAAPPTREIGGAGMSLAPPRSSFIGVQVHELGRRDVFAHSLGLEALQRMKGAVAGALSGGLVSKQLLDCVQTSVGFEKHLRGGGGRVI